MARAIIGNRTTAKEAEEALRALADPARILSFRRFFRNPEHMVFFGVPKAGVRDTARAFGTLPLPEVRRLLGSEVHEVRSLALWILRRAYRAGSPAEKDTIADFYLAERSFVSEWDHVDESAPYILGAHYLDRDDAVFHELARSARMWDRRIAIVATWWFIRNDRFDTTLRLAKTLLTDPEDLMHKAVGWMLREVGKKDAVRLYDFLDRHAVAMPSTMLRYATERFPEIDRARYRALAKTGRRSRSGSL